MGEGVHDATNVEKAKHKKDEANEKIVEGSGGMGFFAKYEAYSGRLPTKKLWKNLPRNEMCLSILIER